MKNRFTQICFCLLTGLLMFSENSRAQITYAATNFASAGDTFLVTRVKLDSLGAANFAQTGANTTWNYSALSPLLQTTDRYFGASNTGYRASYVASCIAGGGGAVACNTQWNNLVNIAHKELDSVKLGTFSFSNLVHHYNKTAAVLPANVLGMTFGLNGVNFPMAIPYQRPDTVLRFPLTYNKRDSCISRYTIDLTAQGISFIYKVNAKRVNHVEGWGALTTPYRNYASTLKLKTTITNNDTVIVNGTVIPVPATVTVEYSWFELNNKRPVLKVKGSTAAGATVYSNIEYIDTARCLSPKASFSKSPLVAFLNQTTQTVNVDFNNTSINSSQYNWNFGDTASGAQNSSTATHPSHTYSKSGTFPVRLISCNNKCQPLRCDTVTIPVVILDSTNVEADFSYYPLQPCAGDTVKFKDLSLNATGWSWSFGDTTTSGLKNPTKVYSSPGTYTVTLIATNGITKDTVKQQVSVLGLPQAAITPFGNFTFCSDDSLILTASGGNYYQWSNGAVSTQIKVKTTGIYFVKAFNNCGVSTSAADTIRSLSYVTPTIAINSNQGTNVCNGAPTTFITFAPYAGDNPVYQWQVNSVNVGTNSPTFTTTGLRNNDTVSCSLVSNYQCRLSSNANSNKIIMTVLNYQTPAVSISASQSNICQGTNVTFFAYPLNGGLAPVYQWRVNNVNVGTNSSSYSSTALANGDMVRCKITSNYQCLTRDTAISPAVTMTVNAVQPSVTITPNPTGPICSNTSVTFTATATNGGATPSFQWRRNLTNVGTNSATYTNATWVNNDTVRCILTSNAACAIPTTATSNVVKMVVATSIVPTVSITANPGDSICAGTNVTFSASGTVMGSAPVYRWKVNNIDTGANLSTFASAVLEDTAVVTVTMTTNATCANPKTVTSSPVRMRVKPLLEPFIAIETDTNTTCQGRPVVFTSSVVNGGTNPVYDWKINGLSTGSVADTFVTTSLTHQDVVSCRLVSNAICATPAEVESVGDTMNILSAPSAFVIITGDSSVCKGNPVELSAPEGFVYEWNTGDTTRTIFADSTGNYSVMLTDSNLCSALSAPASVTIYPLPAPPVITRVTDTLFVTNATSYQWFRNDTLLSGDTSRQLTLLQDGDYRAEIVDSNGCGARSESFEVIGLAVSDIVPGLQARLYPNPNNGQFILTFNDAGVKSILITDATGRKVGEEQVAATSARFDFRHYSPGVYFAEIRWKEQQQVIRLVIQ